MFNLSILKKDYDVGVIKYDTYLKETGFKKSKKYSDIKSIIVFIFPISNIKIRGEYLPARFAYGIDYHLEVIKQIEVAVKKLGLNNYKIFSDISFLQEKVCGHLAGLGTIGKNMLLINPKYGTQFVIGEVVTNDEFTNYDQVIEFDPCLNCDLCIKSCPNQALDNGLIKNRCLSYLNQVDSINFPLYDKMKNIYGCDICQDVCPHNRNLKYEYNCLFDINKKSKIDLDELLLLTEEEYKIKYFDKAFNWISKLQMIRNIIVLKIKYNEITLEKLDLIINEYKDVEWFYNHLQYLRKKVNK
ncbi:MAG TPA: epoxyqueuosine reductase [Acholeplasmataceae bacterium]|nr:epoxyqueuosine reductase [Acholeplasmataceae bacterium]